MSETKFKYIKNLEKGAKIERKNKCLQMTK